MSNITRNDKSMRPAWSYVSTSIIEVQTLEMLESARNVLEQIRDEIRGIRACPQVRRALDNLDAIQRNTAKKPRRKAK